MKISLNPFQFSNFIFFLLLGLSVLSGCKKDDDKENTECDSFASIDGKVTVNGVENQLSIAQLLVSADEDFGDSYSFQIAGFSNDCNELTSVYLNVLIASGSKLNGTYPIRDFFSADKGEAYGSYTKQKISPLSQSSEDLVSGTFKVTENGTKDYTLVIDVKSATGENIKMNLSHKF